MGRVPNLGASRHASLIYMIYQIYPIQLEYIPVESGLSWVARIVSICNLAWQQQNSLFSSDKLSSTQITLRSKAESESRTGLLQNPMKIQYITTENTEGESNVEIVDASTIKDCGSTIKKTFQRIKTLLFSNVVLKTIFI